MSAARLDVFQQWTPWLSEAEHSPQEGHFSTLANHTTEIWKALIG